MHCGVASPDQCLFQKYWHIVEMCVSVGRVPTDQELENSAVLHSTVLGESSTKKQVKSNNVKQVKSNNVMRHECYQTFMYLWKGHLGKGNRIPLPKCVLQGVRQRYPSHDGMYMGYHSS